MAKLIGKQAKRIKYLKMIGYLDAMESFLYDAFLAEDDRNKFLAFVAASRACASARDCIKIAIDFKP